MIARGTSNLLVDIFDKDKFEAEVNKIDSPRARADTIANRTKKTIVEKWEEDPAFYKRFTPDRGGVGYCFFSESGLRYFLIQLMNAESLSKDNVLAVGQNQPGKSSYAPSKTCFFLIALYGPLNEGGRPP